jgi:hypothetical protein
MAVAVFTTAKECGADPLVLTNEGWYEELKKSVGGYVEIVRLTDYLTMWVNEEGLLLNLPINPVGSLAYGVAFDAIGTPIAGDIVFTGGLNGEGEPTSITQEGLDWLSMVGQLGMMMNFGDDD